ncbi:MAG: hypothetical protein H7101_11530, partial [Deinococcales bacterium]|nr:hypothetical protein [Chitinophagaceae bacterium]
FVTTIISCKKNDGGNTTNFPATQGQFTATGGLTADFTGTNSSFTRKTTPSFDSIYVGGFSISPQRVLGLSFKNINTAGTYSLNGGNGSQAAVAAYFVGQNPSTDYYFSSSSSTPGTVIIKSISTTSIEGTYTTTVKNFAGTSVAFSGTFRGNF